MAQLSFIFGILVVFFWKLPATILYAIEQGIREGLAKRRYWRQRLRRAKRDGFSQQDVQDTLAWLQAKQETIECEITRRQKH